MEHSFDTCSTLAGNWLAKLCNSCRRWFLPSEHNVALLVSPRFNLTHLSAIPSLDPDISNQIIPNQQMRKHCPPIYTFRSSIYKEFFSLRDKIKTASISPSQTAATPIGQFVLQAEHSRVQRRTFACIARNRRAMQSERMFYLVWVSVTLMRRTRVFPRESNAPRVILNQPQIRLH
ncbi:hypothetical protein K469DRAFT_260338 [Zopfia rhizophila CBS 207.26]|uniref:Uncharacterized protein n=1 Tax=Zopfia rhizophila CBS 207.26 TaxID=1314779 RepID=A0A6A6DPR7_9PEZI|nr:hypothetical protein K469DRAFT_260338 [Zopfia rhizophila CBS 207.26]